MKRKALASSEITLHSKLFEDIRKMIEEARSAVAVSVNVGMTMLYWQIGKRIHDEILNEKT